MLYRHPTLMKNATYRDVNGRDHPALVIGETPAGTHLAVRDGEFLRIKGPIKHESDAQDGDESWSCAGHDFADGAWSLGGQATRGPFHA
jgi:hypothetical protein